MAHLLAVEDEADIRQVLVWNLGQAGHDVLSAERGTDGLGGALLDEVRDASPENNTRTVDTHVKRLREKLGPAGAYVETVRGVGYRFAETPSK